MSIAVRRIDKTHTIELDHYPTSSITIPIEPTRKWSFRQEAEDGKFKSKIHFSGEEDFYRVIRSGVYVGRKHVEFDAYQVRPKRLVRVRRKPTKKTEKCEDLTEPIREEPIEPAPEIEEPVTKIIERKSVYVYAPPKRKPVYGPNRTSVPMTVSKPALPGIYNLTEDGDYDARVLDLETLALSIIRSDKYPGIDKVAAEDVAKHVLNFFGNRDKMLDNVLEPDDRDAFYILEDSGILKTDREETTLYDGREWRIHYWVLIKDTVYKMAQQQKEIMSKPQDEDTYSKVPDSVWQRTN